MTMPETNARAQVQVDRVTKTFDVAGGERLVALEDVSFAIAPGEFVCLLGRSGCGKSTLLRILAGLEEPTSGTVRFASRAEARPSSAMVFQEHVLFPWRTVLGNVAFGLEEQRRPRTERERIAQHYLQLVGLEAYADDYPKTLSSGMRQRVGVARALAVEPDVLLMDEPSASLDAQTKMDLQRELVRIWQETGTTIVYVTHDVDEAVFLADRVLVLTPGPGRVRAHVPVDLERPRDRVGSAFTALKGRLLRDLQDAPDAEAPSDASLATGGVPT